MKLIDSHTHIHFPQFDKDRSEAIKRSFENEILMINVGTDLITSQTVIKLAQQYLDRMWATIGIHPNDTFGNFPQNNLVQLAGQVGVVAIGETGLDFYRTNEKEKQKLQYEFFEHHIELANQVGKPMTIHIRDAYREAAEFLRKHRVEKGGAMHCFSGLPEDAKVFLDLGFYIGFAGNITFGNNFVETVKYTPLDRLLVETDAPFLAPVPNRGRRNEPAFVEFVARRVAEIKTLPFESITEQVFENTLRLFSLEI